MGEFVMPFNQIVSKDIKHIYSGFPQTVSLRFTPAFPTLEQMRQQDDSHNLKTSVLRISEYDESYGCMIPRAPAFRLLSRHEIDQSVNRLRTPTVASKGLANSSDKAVVNETRSNYPKYLGLKKVNKQEMDQIVSRLNQPTKISEIRRHQTETKLAHVSV
ncbi:hypothetical protein FSP39_020395 [Pinctada imbricata]|uniref:Uncharacterized protein n=1 Tax=Pinctada imbricata TaxID=66713 RepID=A0AA89BZM0_PINIB|nr:hypothetical protein FSP39_020395 [Pinctada imbricata]